MICVILTSVNQVFHKYKNKSDLLHGEVCVRLLLQFAVKHRYSFWICITTFAMKPTCQMRTQQRYFNSTFDLCDRVYSECCVVIFILRLSVLYPPSDLWVVLSTHLKGFE